MNKISEEIIFLIQQIEFVENTTLEVIRYELVSSSTADRKIHMYNIATCDRNLNSQVREVESDLIGFHKMKIRKRLTSLANLSNEKGGPALCNCIVLGNTLTNFDPFPEL